MLILPLFGWKQRRATAETAQRRNLLVAALASSILVANAERSGKTEQFCRAVAS